MSSETEKFLGCILSIKTKLSPICPIVKNIIGTVRSISVDANGALILDDAMSNGEVLNDGFVVRSSDIADLQIIGKSQDFNQVDKQNQKKNITFVKNDLSESNGSGGNVGGGIDKGKENNGNHSDEENNGEPEGVLPEPVRNVLLSNLPPAPVVVPPPVHKIAKPKPRKALHVKKQEKSEEDFANKIANLKVTCEQKENILMKTFGGLKSENATGVLAVFSSTTTTSTMTTTKVPTILNQNPKKMRKPQDKETFDIVTEGMEQDFDFEQSNKLFEKLPVTLHPKPGLVLKKEPKFTEHDTTHKQERVVDSTVVKNSTKCFVTDTGVAIPVVDLPTRSRILNLGNDVGLDHGRMIESMARAVVSTCLPNLGDSHRLSPERCDSARPWILVLAGPHWQGAVGIAAARIFCTLGVHCYVHSPKEELHICLKEEKLYKLCGEGFGRLVSDIPKINYDLIIHSLDDHLNRSLTKGAYQCLLNDSPLCYVDPPLVNSYKEGTGKTRKVLVISPVLPLDYNLEQNVKIFVVNLGLPGSVYLKEGVLYKSFFGDKLVVQVFGKK